MSTADPSAGGKPPPKIEIIVSNSSSGGSSKGEGDEKVQDGRSDHQIRYAEEKRAFLGVSSGGILSTSSSSKESVSEGSGGSGERSPVVDDQEGVVKGLGQKAEGPTPGSSPSQQLKKTPEDFIFGKEIGKGSYSSVYLAKDVKSGKEYAIKVCDKHHIIREKKTESIKREKDVMTILSGNRDPTAPYFVHLYATFQDSHRLYFVMTYAHGGELLKFLNKQGSFEKKVCQFYAGEIVQALKHLHRLGIIHRDLKPENILLSESGHIFVTDFGSAKILQLPLAPPSPVSEIESAKPVPGSGRGRSNSFVGTAQYVSPEVLQGRYKEVGPAADLWALGCIIFQFLTGGFPFTGQSEFLIFKKILSLDYIYPEDIDPDAKDLISSLLKLQYSERLGALDTVYYTSIQNHPFFAGINFDTLHEQQPPIISLESKSDASPQKSIVRIPSTYEPGFNPRVIAERFLRCDSDENLWGWGDSQVSSDESEECKPKQPIASNQDEAETETSNTTERLNKLNIQGQQRCNSECMGAQPRRSSKGKISFPIDLQDKTSRLEEQARSNPWHNAVKGNLILKQGLVSKRKGLFSRRRMFLLTEGPHLYYCDPTSKNVKGEIPWSASVRGEAKDFKIFYIHTPNRTYYLEDQDGFALSWCDAINAMVQRTFEDKNDQAKRS